MSQDERQPGRREVGRLTEAGGYGSAVVVGRWRHGRTNGNRRPRLTREIRIIASVECHVPGFYVVSMSARPDTFLNDKRSAHIQAATACWSS